MAWNAFDTANVMVLWAFCRREAGNALGFFWDGGGGGGGGGVWVGAILSIHPNLTTCMLQGFEATKSAYVITPWRQWRDLTPRYRGSSILFLLSVHFFLHPHPRFYPHLLRYTGGSGLTWLEARAQKFPRPEAPRMKCPWTRPYTCGANLWWPGVRTKKTKQERLTMGTHWASVYWFTPWECLLNGRGEQRNYWAIKRERRNGHAWDTLGTLSRDSRDTLGTLSEHSGHSWDTFITLSGHSEQSRDTFEKLLGHPRNTLGTLSEYSSDIPGTL